VLEVRGKLLADVLRERQAALAPSLAMDDDLSSSPVEIIERECRGLAGSQAQPDQESDDGGIAPAHGRLLVGRVE
jgi:hypothetical protein